MRRRSVHVCLWIALLTLSVMAILPSQVYCAPSIRTYKDSSYTTLKTIFTQGETVYTKADGLDASKYYKIQWFFGTTLKSESSVATGLTFLTHSYPLATDAEIGAWNVKILQRRADLTWEVKGAATFYVWDDIAPEADSWVEMSHPADNHGGDTKLHVRVDWDAGKGQVTNLRRTYLKFSLSGLPSGTVIYSAKLHLYRTTSDPDIPSAYKTTDSWTEMGINWNNQPAAGDFVADGTPEGDHWIEWDLTSYTQSEFAGDKTLSIVLKFKTESRSYQHADFTSREGTWNQHPWLEISYPPSVETTDSGGNVKNEFLTAETIYIMGGGYNPSTTYPLYVVQDTMWTNGMNIPDRVPGTQTSVTTDGSGNIPVGTVAWSTGVPGKYDIIVDVNGNGKYDEGIDALDDRDIQVTAGFFVVPELTGGTATALILALGSLILHRKRRISG